MTTEQEAFATAVGALRPYLSKIVVVGGWAHRLFVLRPDATPPAFRPLVTDDADIATPLALDVHEKRIDLLLKEVGFVEELAGDELPPVASYVLKTEDQDFELAFIADLKGSRTTRDGKRDVTVAVAGVVAQKLRWVSALLVAPWTVTLDEHNGYPVPGGGPVTVQIANATSYLFQKLMVLPARMASGKGGKDALYMFDTLRLFASSLDDLHATREVLFDRFPGSAPKELESLAQRYFGTGTSDAVVAAAVVARESGRAEPPSAAMIAATCRAGFAAVFG